MYLIDWLTRRKKGLAHLTRSELRRKELLLEKERARLLLRIKKLADDKQQVFDRGAAEKTPEVRQALAQEFELKTAEQLVIARQLNVRSKEVLTLAKLRMLRENADRAKAGGGRLGLVSEADILRLGKLIENDAVKSELYEERLDEMIRTGAAVAEEGLSALSESGAAVMNVWKKMDSGRIADASQAFEEADRQVREKHRSAEG